MNAHARSWQVTPGDGAALIAGHADTVHLRADDVTCIDGIMLKDPAGKELKADWKAVKANEIEVKLPLQQATPGALTMMVTQYGMAEGQAVPIEVFSEAGRFDGFTLHAGEVQGTLTGSQLNEVGTLTVKGLTFVPGAAHLAADSRTPGDEMPMVAQDAAAAVALKPEHGLSAKLVLRDGRVLSLPASIEAPRPHVTLISKNVLPAASSAPSNIALSDIGQLPHDATLVFSLRTLSPPSFARDASIEVATADESAITSLSLANGGLTLENSQVAVATLNPAKAFSASTFGPLFFRVNAKGVDDDWQPLTILVRLPALQKLICPQAPELACKLVGTQLFLIDAVAGDADFTHAVSVPDGFLAAALPVPHPASDAIYFKLRDSPQVIDSAALTVELLPTPTQDADRSAARATAVPPQ